MNWVDSPDVNGTAQQTQDPIATRLRPDPRLPAYIFGGLGALLLSIATGSSELAALGAPFIVLAALGMRDRRPPLVSGEVRIGEHRVIEGDRLEGEVLVTWDGEAEVDVLLTGMRGMSPIAPTPIVGWSLKGRGPKTLPFTVEARSWGVHDMGTLRVRARRPGSLLVWESLVDSAPAVRVLPTPLRVDRLLRPAEPRAVSGLHLSRMRGHGTDFAELRPYRPGDRLRDLSWAASARLGAPWVTVHHPERTGTVLLLLDAVLRSDRDSAEVLARAARTAWAVASVHLKAQDRVGLLAQGRTAAWLPPQGGRRARMLLLDELLAVGGAAEDRWRNRRPRSRVVIPADALIVGITSLGTRMFVRNLLHYRRTGHSAVALVLDAEDLLPPVGDDTERTARRVWLAQRDASRFSLERGGIPTAMVTGVAGVAAATSALRRRMASLPSANQGRARA